jgi:hypothetical protein
MRAQTQRTITRLLQGCPAVVPCNEASWCRSGSARQMRALGSDKPIKWPSSDTCVQAQTEPWRALQCLSIATTPTCVVLFQARTGKGQLQASTVSRPQSLASHYQRACIHQQLQYAKWPKCGDQGGYASGLLMTHIAGATATAGAGGMAAALGWFTPATRACECLLAWKLQNLHPPLHAAPW